jgi:3-dehydroquinate synthase
MNSLGNVLFGGEALHLLRSELISNYKNHNKCVFLTDQNTSTYCLPILYKLLQLHEIEFPTIIIPAGEEYKNLETASTIWSELTKINAGRDALLINLGGGVVTDIGGFAASCYKRGIRTIHIPTTLLGMVDAAIGGKTGIDFQYLKNHIGTFYPPMNVLIFTEFLSTLPKRQLLSGFGELLKYGFIANPDLLDIDPEQLTLNSNWEDSIHKCAAIKLEITHDDPNEKGLRKILNFGHTIGHAFESYALESNISLYHGEAIAAGMLIELYLSHKIFGLAVKNIHTYTHIFKKYYTPFTFPPEIMDNLIDRMSQDKKNAGKSFRFVLLNDLGKPSYDVEIASEIIREGLVYYSETIE